jgi:hypothetical protein
MCLTLSYVLECTECGHRQSLGTSLRQVCRVAVEGKPCIHHDLEHPDQHVCGSCLLEKEEEEAKMEAAKTEEEKNQGNQK